MGWYLRRSIGFGPLRLNLSGSGIGYSMGVRGLRMGRSATGRRYTSMSVPGTGLRYINYRNSSPGYVRRIAAAGAAAPRKKRGCCSCLLWAIFIFFVVLIVLGALTNKGIHHG